MNEEQHSLHNIDSLVFQLALQTRELYQKKNEIKQQIKVCRDGIAEKKSYIGTIQENIKKLEEQVGVTQSAVMKNKENAKTEVYEERISSFRKTLQSFKESYHQNPLAQKFLALQAEKEQLESRIKAWDDQIMTKQKELEHLTYPTVNSFSTEELPDSAFVEQATVEQEEPEHQTKDGRDSSIIDISSIHLNQTANEDETSVKSNAEEIHEQNNVQDPPAWSGQQQSQSDEIHSEAQDEETSKEDQELVVSGVGDVLMENGAAAEEEKAPDEEDHQEVTVLPQTSSQGVDPQSTLVPSTPAFPFNFSPTSSPHRGTSDTKSPAFLFSSVSTSGFSEFGFDMGSSQEEDSSFAFPGSFFNEKKAAEAKPSSCPEFLFNQPEQNEDFQFAFAAKSPRSASKENRDEFSFSFNF
ncbi:uncharacterized protein LOC108240771 isoform X2 [Kryptolebias marmoratus]|uniref:uncharacterized protein LOC108240771 isoform X2 n=1 Tax=Kryptolebias marmoratus TaxID=37003 RepID=UPI0018AC97A0|nr:uncharacterized protein LOC108240771 isoform X2 [Kryptolebias marmoratus]